MIPIIKWDRFEVSFTGDNTNQEYPYKGYVYSIISSHEYDAMDHQSSILGKEKSGIGRGFGSRLGRDTK